MRSIRILALAALTVALASCGSSDGSHNPVPGFLTLTLNTPHSNDGALLFKVSGGVIDSVAPFPMVQSGSYVINGGFTRVVVAGNLVDGAVVKVRVPDVQNASDYSVLIEQAAVRTTFAQQNLSGYSVTVTAP